MDLSDAVLYWIVGVCLLVLLGIGWLWRRERLRAW